MLPLCNASGTLRYTRHCDERTRSYSPGRECRLVRGRKGKPPACATRRNSVTHRRPFRWSGFRPWDRPASASLSSRLPYGREGPPERPRLVERGEAELRALGFRQCRVRLHDKLARVEIAPDEMPRALAAEMAAAIADRLKAAGFTYVALDLEGYRQGSLNETLSSTGQRSAKSAQGT